LIGESVITLEEVSHGLAFLEGNKCQQGIACEGEIQSSLGASVAMMVFLPYTGVALVMVAVFDAPVTPDYLWKACVFSFTERLEEKKLT